MNPRVLAVGVHFSLDELGKQNVYRYCVRKEVVLKVIEHLKDIIDPNVTVSPQMMETLAMAVSQLCKAESIEEIDWVGVMTLAAAVDTLSKARCIQPA